MELRGLTSYAHEAEDLIALRLLRDVLKIETGRYLDIGAFHPQRSSNTHLLYRLGWRGINVDANPDHMGEFARQRPDDLNLNAAIAPTTGTALYHRFRDPELNGFFSEQQAVAIEARGVERLPSREVPCVAVAEFLGAVVHGPVDFLSIDIESREAEVFRAWDWSLCRPKVICAEIHGNFMDDIEAHETFAVLKDAGYKLISRIWQSAFFIDPAPYWQVQAEPLCTAKCPEPPVVQVEAVVQFVQ